MSQIKKELMLSGDKVVMLEKNGQFYFENSAMPAFSRAEEAFEGESEKAGFHSEEAMQDYMKDIRKEVRGISLWVYAIVKISRYWQQQFWKVLTCL